MPVDTRINVPFIPQEGITSQILTAIQLANEQSRSRQQLATQQQQVTQQGQLIPAQIEEAKARAGFYGSEAQKNQLQTDMMKRAQAMFSEPQGATPQPQGTPAQPQVPAPQPQGGKWLPQNTPSQLAPFVAAMIPTDLTDQEKAVIEGGAQAGRFKAMQAGDIAGYLNEIRAGVDSVVTNRNKNVENQPLNPDERSNFSKNVLPSFENLSPAQKKGAQAELTGVKTRRELDQLEGRLMQQDNQALQRKIAQENLVANKEMAHGQALDLAGRNKIVADTKDWTDSSRQINLTLKTLDEAKNGDDLATRMVPTMEVLGVNTAGKIRRISPTEYDASRVPVAWVNRFNQWASSVGEGATTPAMVQEGKQLMHDLADTQYNSYLSNAQSTALTFGKIDPKSIYVVDKNNQVSTLADATKSAPKAAGTLPAGAVAGTLNGKHGYVLNGEFHQD